MLIFITQQSEINVGNNVDIMVASPNTHLLVATGGKENDLKLWDGNKCEAPPIFKAKNVCFTTVNGYAIPKSRSLMIILIYVFLFG